MPLIRKPRGAAEPPPPAPDVAAVLHALTSGTDDQRWSAARAAADTGSVTALRDALKVETNPRVREAMFTGLARIGTPESVEAVLPFLRSDNALVRTEAVDALAAMKSVAWPYLDGLVRDDNPDARILACELLRNVPNDEAIHLLCDLLDSDPEPNVCACAVDVLAEIGGTEALPSLARCERRFPSTPFLAFSIKVATDRIRSQVSGPSD